MGIWSSYVHLIEYFSDAWWIYLVRVGLAMYIMGFLLWKARKYNFLQEEDEEYIYIIPKGRAISVIGGLLAGSIMPVGSLIKHHNYRTPYAFLCVMPAFIIGPVFISRRLTGSYKLRKTLVVFIYVLILLVYLFVF